MFTSIIIHGCFTYFLNLCVHYACVEHIQASRKNQGSLVIFQLCFVEATQVTTRLLEPPQAGDSDGRVSQNRVTLVEGFLWFGILKGLL